MSLISLIHPSRGRAKKSFENSRNWIQKAGCDTELIVSIDSSDTQKNLYYEYYRGKIIVNDNDCVVQAANHAAKASKGDILIYLSDDFDCPDNWGQGIEQAVRSFNEPWLLKVDDCLQRFEADVLTVPIMSRSLYEKLGYFFHPEYKSMFVDQNLYHTVKNMGALKFAEWLKFPHNHYCNGKTSIDETYKRSNENWNSGKELYAKHKSQGFPPYK